MHVVKAARTAGFTRIIDVSDAYDGLDPAGLSVEPDDFHPNAMAHERLARWLDRALSDLPELQPLWTRGPVSLIVVHACREVLPAHQPTSGGAAIAVRPDAQAGEPR